MICCWPYANLIQNETVPATLKKTFASSVTDRQQKHQIACQMGRYDWWKVIGDAYSMVRVQLLHWFHLWSFATIFCLTDQVRP